ncbi:asparagine synthase-related protein [Sandaracinus amylolyticus]|uniref:asparagine synthase-related protein n=1 Tax=Sandaracinus amylolyticus TaxID=927083 RepID=UPI001F3345B0|nr:asparagine synthase-related protein [Sandaracinus amylolyticus]UJR78424.1 Asparagine synthase [Sandaracinus amylolyticus]
MKTGSEGPAVHDRVIEGEGSRAPSDVRDALIARGARALEGCTGQFALHASDGEQHVLARDACGVAKLFYALRADGTLDSSNYLADLRARGHAASAISSVPSGHVVRVVPSRRELALERWSSLRFGASDARWDEASLAEHASRIRRALDETFHALAAGHDGGPLYVTLSGGLDSTVIAMLARAHLGPFTAITFALEGVHGTHSDLAHASRVARELGVAHEIVCVGPDVLRGHLDEALVHGQDWRDFNVHCALVNAALAEWIQARDHDRRPLVITGDGMNELVADYTPVRVDGRDLYPLPRMPAGRMRRFLVQGLDTGDREVGVYARRGIDCAQPYAMCAHAYAALPDRAVESPDAKQALARAVMGDRIPEHVLARPKVRAQVGSSDEVAGTLRAMLDAGIDGASLERRFESLLEMTSAERRALMRAGMYRFARTFEELEA